MKRLSHTAQIHLPQLERNKRRKDTSALKKRPEHVVIDYKYVDLEGSGILAVEGEPTNAKFYTERPVLWKTHSYNTTWVFINRTSTVKCQHFDLLRMVINC